MLLVGVSTTKNAHIKGKSGLRWNFPIHHIHTHNFPFIVRVPCFDILPRRNVTSERPKFQNSTCHNYVLYCPRSYILIMTSITMQYLLHNIRKHYSKHTTKLMHNRMDLIWKWDDQHNNSAITTDPKQCILYSCKY